MKRKYKIILIVLISAILTYLIYFFNKDEKINIVALGDGIASGETSYNIDGISFNDYIKEYYDSKKLLKNYDNKYAFKNYKINDLINDLKNNNLHEDEDLFIKQILHNASLITISIGEEELVKLAITKDLDTDYLKKFISEYDDLMYLLKDITEAKIVLVGFYENKYLDKGKVIILNSELSNIAIKYQAIFLNISDLMLNKVFYVNDNSFYFNYKGHKEIAEMIIHSI